MIRNAVAKTLSLLLILGGAGWVSQQAAAQGPGTLRPGGPGKGCGTYPAGGVKSSNDGRFRG